MVAPASGAGPGKGARRSNSGRSTPGGPEESGDPDVEWVTTTVADVVRAYWWVGPATILGLAVILSGFAARVAIGLGDSFAIWAASWHP